MVITFMGHRDTVITEKLLQKIRRTIEERIGEERIIFYCGGEGNFDLACAEVLRDLKKQYPQIRCYLIAAYINEKVWSEAKKKGLYDGVFYPFLKIPPKYAIAKRNEYMINEADLVIFCVERPSGGAYNALVYARRKKKHLLYISL